MTRVAVVGAGLAGLACARRLVRAGLDVTVLERDHRPGGRVQSDDVDGFTLDRGFQVLLDGYPELRDEVDLDALCLRAFSPGAIVRLSGRFARVGDPTRDPLSAPRTLLSGVFSLPDALRVLDMRRTFADAAHANPGLESVRTMELIRTLGFSRRAIDRFFRPFFGGVFLDPTLSAGADFFVFVFRMFARGRATLPAQGMRALPLQLAAGLPPGVLRLGARVQRLRDSELDVADGDPVRADRVVLATDAFTSAALLGRREARGWSGGVTFWYDAEQPPTRRPLLVLNANGRLSGPVNHLCVSSAVQPSYAPAGRHLVGATVVDATGASPPELERQGRTQLERWYGPAVREWRLLRIDDIPRALPRRWPAARDRDARVRLTDRMYACGDWLEGPSIDGALRSGRRAAERLLLDLGLPATAGAR